MKMVQDFAQQSAVTSKFNRFSRLESLVGRGEHRRDDGTSLPVSCKISNYHLADDATVLIDEPLD